MTHTSRTPLNWLFFCAGGVFLLLGLFMAFVTKNPHFYTPFSIGLTLILARTHFLLTRRNIFRDWETEQWVRFTALLIVACVVTDLLGIGLGFWHYPHYDGAFDRIIQTVFEFAVPLVYFLYTLLIGEFFFHGFVKDHRASWTLGLVVFPSLMLIATDICNAPSRSWMVTLPLSIWYTVGAWLMALIPLGIYIFVDRTATRE